jgi:hypothetical protein
MHKGLPRRSGAIVTSEFARPPSIRRMFEEVVGAFTMVIEVDRSRPTCDCP